MFKYSLVGLCRSGTTAVFSLGVFALLSDVLAELNLFQDAEDHDAADSKYVPCQDDIIEKFKAENGTGSQVRGLNKNNQLNLTLLNVSTFQAYVITESMIQFCPNFCDNLTTIHTFCESHEKAYVRDLTAKVKSNRCCDERACNCICHFDCQTFNSRMEQFKTQGFDECFVKKKKKDVLKKAEAKCKTRQKESSCRKKKMTFVCPKQVICTARKCGACINPNCLTKETKKLTKILLKAQNATEIKQLKEV